MKLIHRAKVIAKNHISLVYAVAISVIFLVAGILALGPASRWLASISGSNGLSSDQRMNAVNNARTSLLQYLAGVAAFGALIYSARNHLISRRTYDLAERGQVTNLFTKAVEQMSSTAIEIRLGGIYALERIARDSAPDHQMIVEVLCAYVRGHATESAPYPEDDEGNRIVPTDVQVVMQVLGRRNALHDKMPLDLRGVSLPGLELYDADLSGCFMPNSDLSHCSFHRVSMVGSRLMYSNFDMSHIVDTDMTGSSLVRTSFKEAYIYNVIFSGSDLSNYSSLSSAQLFKVALNDTNLESADLSGTQFSETDLTAVDFATVDLSKADLSNTVGLSIDDVSGALWDEETSFPDFDVTEQSEPFLVDFCVALARRLGGSQGDWAARMQLELVSLKEIDLVVETDSCSTVVELEPYPSDEAKRALLELDVNNPEVNGRRFKWDKQNGIWVLS